MLRYLIIIWNIDSASDHDVVRNMQRHTLQSADRWRLVLDIPGLFVACKDHDLHSNPTIPLDNCGGVILGTIFSSPEPTYSEWPMRIRSLSGSQSEKILRSMGRSLVSEYWGHYVAVLHYRREGRSVVLRSPVSPLACFHARRGNVSVFFSYLDDCIDLEFTPLSINWDSIVAQVSSADYLSNETAITEIDAIECGESVHCDVTGCSRRIYWDPRSFLEERSSVNFDEAAQAVRRKTEYCTSAFAARHDKILVNLSGGLDSSIVLSSLSRTPHKPSITAVNYYSNGSGDERRFARSMANAVKCRLIERPRNQQLDLHRFLDCNRTVRPVLNFSAPDVEARNNALARELGATAVFDGELGDNVFGSNPNPGALVECFRQSGLGRGFLSATVDYAMLTRQSLWRTLTLALREAQSVAKSPDFAASGEMLQPYATDRPRWTILASKGAKERHRGFAERFLHPWFKESRRIAPGSHALLFGLVTVTSTTYHSPFSGARDPPRVSPIVSQPMIENALRMPTHWRFKSAEDRAVARAAFADALPQEILQRGLGKGGPTLWLRGVIDSNVEFIREFLLDGILVRQGLIDPTTLEAALSPGIAKSAVIAGDIFAKLYIEVWLRGAQQAWAMPGGRRESAGT